nr:MAG TPA: hypothetical protein [Caudoviricetes sp.]
MHSAKKHLKKGWILRLFYSLQLCDSKFLLKVDE